MSAPEQRLADSVIALGAHNVDLPTWLAAQEVVWHREQEGRGAIPSDKAGPGWVARVTFRKGGGWYDYWLPVGVIPEGSIVIGRRVKVERSQSWQDGEATVVGLDGSCRAVRPPSCTNEILGFAE